MITNLQMYVKPQNHKQYLYFETLDLINFFETWFSNYRKCMIYSIKTSVCYFQST